MKANGGNWILSWIKDEARPSAHVEAVLPQPLAA
jgi:hypothetical protein